MILEQVYLLIVILFLAGKDATSFRLKDQNLIASNGNLTDKRIKRWHRDGVVLWILATISPLYYTENYWLILYSLLLRLAFYDIAFNKWGGLSYKFLGSTAFWDKTFIKVFGLNGAIYKSISFLFLLIVLNIILYYV